MILLFPHSEEEFIFLTIIPLRYMTMETLKKDAFFFPVKDALMFIEANPYGQPGLFMGKFF